MAPVRAMSGANPRQRAPKRSLVSNQSAELVLGSHSTTARFGGSKLSQMNGPDCLPLLFRRLLGSENVPACRNEQAALEARLHLNNLLNFRMMQFKVKHFTQFQEALHKKLCQYRLERRQFARQSRKLEQELGLEPPPIEFSQTDPCFQRRRMNVNVESSKAPSSVASQERPSIVDTRMLTRRSEDLQRTWPSVRFMERRQSKANSAREHDMSDSFDLLQMPQEGREHRPSISASVPSNGGHQQKRASESEFGVFGKLKSVLSRWGTNDDAQYLAGIKVDSNEVRSFRQKHKAQNVPQSIPEDTVFNETSGSGNHSALRQTQETTAEELTQSYEIKAATLEDSDLVAYMRDVRQIKTLKFKKMVNTAFTAYQLEGRQELGPHFTKYALKHVGNEGRTLELVPLVQTSAETNANRTREQDFEFAIPSMKRVYKLERLKRHARSQYLDTLINASQFNPSVKVLSD